MASTTAVTTTAGPEHIVITIPPEVYQYADRRRGAEQGIELQAMEGENQAGLRSRTRGRQNQRDASQSESSTGTLTPSSSTTSSIDKGMQTRLVLASDALRIGVAKQLTAANRLDP